jgi:putative tricarboxylic transport membrane protein
MTRGWQVVSLVFLGLSILTLVSSLEFSLTDPLGPGPGFFPFWLSVAGGGLALLLLVQVTRAGVVSKPGETLVPDRTGGRRVLSVLVSLVGVAVLLAPLGYRLTALAFIGALLVALGIRTWWIITAFALAGSFGVYHVFSEWLKVPLPTGVFGV